MPKKPSDQDVLAFWFTETPPEFWFKKDAEFDARIARSICRNRERRPCRQMRSLGK